MNPFKYLQELIQVRLRERKLRKQVIKQIAKGDDKELQNMAIKVADNQSQNTDVQSCETPNVSIASSEYIPKIVGAMSEQSQVQTIKKIQDNLPPEQISEVFQVIDSETLEKKFTSKYFEKKFITIIAKLALAEDVDNCVLTLCRENDVYENLYSMINMAESKSESLKTENVLKPYVLIDILKTLQTDDRFKDDKEKMIKCMSLYIAYQIAKYGSSPQMYEFQALLGHDNNEKRQLPECIEFEYNKIIQAKRVSTPHQYDKQWCKETIEKCITNQEAVEQTLIERRRTTRYSK